MNVKELIAALAEYDDDAEVWAMTDEEVGVEPIIQVERGCVWNGHNVPILTSVELQKREK